MPKDPDPERPPDIELGARVRMKELRVEDTHEVHASTHGTPGHESESVRETENLPNELEPGKTYRRARVRRYVSIRISEGGG